MTLFAYKPAEQADRQASPALPQADLLDGFSAWLADKFEYPYALLTRKTYRRIARDFLLYATNQASQQDQIQDAKTKGSVGIKSCFSAVRPSHLRAFITKTPAGVRYAAATRVTRQAALQLFWRYLAEQQGLRKNVMRDFLKEKEAERAQAGRGGRKPKRMPIVLTWEDQDALLSAVAVNPNLDIRARDQAMVALLLVTGLRRSECCQLPANALAQMADGRVRVIGKGDKERSILFNPDDCQLRAALATWEPWRELYRQRAESRGLSVSTYFLTRTGRALGPNLVYQQVSNYIKQAGLMPGRYGPHVLRHTAASRMLAQNVPIRRVMENLGHEHLTTLELYAHLLEAPAGLA